MKARTCGSTDFFFHSDLSGKVRLVSRGQPEVEVPGEDLLFFVLDYLKDRAISELEAATDEELIARFTR